MSLGDVRVLFCPSIPAPPSWEPFRVCVAPAVALALVFARAVMKLVLVIPSVFLVVLANVVFKELMEVSYDSVSMIKIESLSVR